MISISLCMIIKNEEKLLKRCLDSYRPIPAQPTAPKKSPPDIRI